MIVVRVGMVIGFEFDKFLCIFGEILVVVMEVIRLIVFFLFGVIMIFGIIIKFGNVVIKGGVIGVVFVGFLL